jgi:CHASE3 domain sensor protein
MKNFFRDNWIVIVIGVAFIISTTIAVRNTYIIDKNQATIQQTDLVQESTQEVLTKIMHGLDLGLRGYSITRDDKLLTPYHEAVAVTPHVFKTIDSLLTVQNYPERDKAVRLKAEINAYISFCKEMIQKVNSGDMESFAAGIKEDRGYNVWSQYSQFSAPLFAYQNELERKALEDYKVAFRTNLTLQIAISVLGIPLLFYFVRRIIGERHRRKKVLETVDHADRNYLFNDGSVVDTISEDVNERSLSHIKVACDFVASLAEDKYDVEWKGMTPANRSINTQTLAGNLVRLRERLKAVKLDDQRRHWVNEGLARFSEIVRSNQQSAEKLTNESITFLTKYIKAQQGSLFVVQSDGDETILKLESCYAFNRKKWVEKEIPIGCGTIGQVYLEGGSVLMTDVPQNYTTITSGLGDATPNCIVIIPMKNNDEIAAIAEFATFGVIKDYEIGFLEKAGEFLASTILNTTKAAKMKSLLDEAAEREAMMRERDEELRQNMEELQATQEQIERNKMYVAR